MAEISSINGGGAQEASEAPHSIEAEQQVLGALLLNNDSMLKISGHINADDFYDPVHSRIFKAVAERIDAGQLASPVTLKPVFENDDGLKELGGLKYLARIAGASISAFAIADYASLIKDTASKRKLIDVFSDARSRIDAGEGAASIAQSVEKSAGDTLGAASTKPLTRSHLSGVISTVSRINDAFMGKDSSGISTGLPQLDNAIGGFRPGNLIVLGARPSMGKSSIAQTIAFNAASAGVGTLFLSLEMSNDEVTTRFLSIGLAKNGKKVPYNNLLHGAPSEEHLRLIVDEAKRQEAIPIEVGERDVREIGRMRSAAKRVQQRMADSGCPLGLIILDYLQLVDVEGARSTYDRVSAASDRSKSLAMDLEVPVLALSQLSRRIEEREDKRPQLSDLRESGRVEEDADVVLFAYREAYYLQRELEGEKDMEVRAEKLTRLERCHDQLDLIVSKQRAGALSTVPLFADMATSLISEDRSGGASELI